MEVYEIVVCQLQSVWALYPKNIFILYYYHLINILYFLHKKPKLHVVIKWKGLYSLFYSELNCYYGS